MIKGALLLLTLTTSIVLGMDLSWPTDDTSFWQGAPIHSFIQPAASGTTESGLFGYARNSGTKFHEGIDIKPKKRDRKGEATDKILAAIDGHVVHINTIAGNSNYGKYIVILHEDLQPQIYTLYAHLSNIEPNLKIGKKVRSGETIATMGRSSSGSPIPKTRAHLHFEMGLMLSENFQKWYNTQKFGTPNKHSIWNGFNLTGFDPLDFYTQWKNGKITNVNDYFKQFPVAFSLRIFDTIIPNFIKRYPSLATKPIDPKTLKGWDIDFTWFALPFRWTPLYGETKTNKTQPPILTAYNSNIFTQHNCSDTITLKVNKTPIHGKVLKKTLNLLFEH